MVRSIVSGIIAGVCVLLMVTPGPAKTASSRTALPTSPPGTPSSWLTAQPLVVFHPLFRPPAGPRPTKGMQSNIVFHPVTYVSGRKAPTSAVFDPRLHGFIYGSIAPLPEYSAKPGRGTTLRGDNGELVITDEIIRPSTAPQTDPGFELELMAYTLKSNRSVSYCWMYRPASVSPSLFNESSTSHSTLFVSYDGSVIIRSTFLVCR